MSRSGREPNCTLIVRDLADGARSDELRDIFKEYGNVKDVYIPLDYYTRKQRGFAYVQFEDPRDAKDALNDLDGNKYMDREMRIDIARGDRKTPAEMNSRQRGSRDRRRHEYTDRRSRRYLDNDDDDYRRRDRSRSRDPRKRSRSSSSPESSYKRRRYELPESSKRSSRRDRSRSHFRSKRRRNESTDSPVRFSRNNKSRSNSRGSTCISHQELEQVTPKNDCSKSSVKDSPTFDDAHLQRSPSLNNLEKRKRTKSGSHESRSRSRSRDSKSRSRTRSGYCLDRS